MSGLLLLCAALIACDGGTTDAAEVEQLPRLLWWLMPLDGSSPSGGRDETIWMASGNFNNWLFIIPRHDLVVVVTGGDNRSFGTPVDFLYREILPSVRLP